MTAPQGFVVLGDTDWWDVTKRNTSTIVVNVDSRLRFARSDFWTTGTRSLYSAGRVKPGTVPVYAEFLTVYSGATTTLGIGVAPSTETTTDARAAPLGFSAVLYLGNTYRGGSTTVDTGLGNITGGDVLGLLMWKDGADGKVQFYRNGSTHGSEITIDADTQYSLVALFGNVRGIVMRVDAGDPFDHFPAGAQPWGAAARVADRGGYSPAATVFTRSDSDFTLDAFARTSTGTAVVTGLSICDTAPALHGRSGIYYCEFPIETDTGTLGVVGLEPRDGSVANTTGGSSGFGFFLNTGQKRTASANSAYGSAAVVSDVVGMIWEPSTGKLYWSINDTIQNSGDPEAGTGFAFNTATADLVPAVTPFQGRVRICTHAREQKYRPAYAEPWDGADLLPEQHFTDRIKQAPRVRREVSYYPWANQRPRVRSEVSYPWANQRRRGAPIGALDLINADGALDVLSEYDLRDQQIIAYRVRADGSTAREFTGLADGVTHPDARTCRIAIADMTAKLAVRVAAPVFALGAPELIPSKSRIGSVIASDVAQSTLAQFTVYDQALAVSSWFRSDVDGVAGFERSVNPAGLQSVRDFELVSDLGDAGLSNGDFASGSTGWTSGVSGTGATIAPSFSSGTCTMRARDDLATNSWENYLRQTISTETGALYYVTLDVNSLDSNIWLMFNAAPVARATGKHTFTFTAASSSTVFELTTFAVPSASQPTQSIVIDNITINKVQLTKSAEDAIRYLLESEGSLTAADWSYTAHFGSYSPGQIGYWSDQRPSVDTVLGEVCSSLLVDTYTDASGVIQLAWMLPPDEVSSIDSEYLGELAESDFFGDITVADDYAPRLSTVAEYQRNYAKHNDGDIAGSVSATVRQYVTSERREHTLDVSSVSAGDAGPLHPFYAFAENAPFWPRLCVNDFTDANTPNNGSTTVDNGLILLHRCYMQRRRFYTGKVDRVRAEALGLRPGGVVEVTHRRYGLASGKNLMVVSMDSDLTGETVPVVLWG